MTFAKLFGADRDQVLALLQQNDEGDPEVRFFFQPPHLGVCSIAFVFNKEEDDEDQRWTHAETYFARVDESEARSAIAPALKLAGNVEPKPNGHAPRGES